MYLVIFIAGQKGQVKTSNENVAVTIVFKLPKQVIRKK